MVALQIVVLATAAVWLMGLAADEVLCRLTGQESLMEWAERERAEMDREAAGCEQ